MSRIKLCLSFVLMLLLVGMYSMITFAAVPDAPVNLKFTSTATNTVTITWDAVQGSTSYNVYWDTDPVVNQTGTTFTKTAILPDTVYYVKVSSLNVEEESTKTTLKVLFHNPTVPTKDLAKPDNNVMNANRSGVGIGPELIKSNNQMYNNPTKAPGTHKIHGDYQNNTNACASCHQTHTAASSNLLFKNGTYNTCTACHDGTLGFYNVFGTSNEDDMGAGTFGGTHAGNMSVHLSTGALKIGAAPGNNVKAGGSITGDFTCASCHDPHGSFSDRLLKNNPNNMSTVVRTVVKDASGADSAVYGNKLDSVPVYKINNLPVSGTALLKTDYAFVDMTIAAADVEPGGYWAGTELQAEDRVLQLVRYTGSTLPGPKTGWVYTGGIYLSKTGALQAVANWPTLWNNTTQVAFTTQDVQDGKYWLNNEKGYYRLPAADTISAVKNVQKAYIVKLDLKNTDEEGNPIQLVGSIQPLRSDNAALATGTSIWKNKGVEYNEWCGTCHIDYFTRTKYNTGLDQNLNHHTMSDSYNCARCHFAHGTDAKIMRDATGRTYEELQKEGFTPAQAFDYLKDQNASSALKRFTNMSVCYGCHTEAKSSSFINSTGYNKADSPNGWANTHEGEELIPTPYRP